MAPYWAAAAAAAKGHAPGAVRVPSSAPLASRTAAAWRPVRRPRGASAVRAPPFEPPSPRAPPPSRAARPTAGTALGRREIASGRREIASGWREIASGARPLRHRRVRPSAVPAHTRRRGGPPPPSPTPRESEASRKSRGSRSEVAQKSLGSGPAPPPSPAHPPTRSTEGPMHAAASSWAEARPPRTVPKASTRHGGRPARRQAHPAHRPARRPANGPMANPGVNGPLARPGVNECPSCEAAKRTRPWASWWARRCSRAVPGERCSGERCSERWVGVARSTEARAEARGEGLRLHEARRAVLLSPAWGRRLLPHRLLRTPQRLRRYPPARR